MKKKTVIITSLSVLLIATVLTFIKANLVTLSVAQKAEKKFCPPPSAERPLVQPKNRKLIKTGDLSFECDSLNETRVLIEQAVKQLDGFISDERLSLYEKRSTQWLEIRVPADHFDALVEAISKGASRLEKRSVHIEDVTDQYMDTETRLAVKRELETRYRELLAGAKEMKDLLAIEEQIAKLRADIESAEGQLKRMDGQITLSTLEVTYYELTEGSPIRFSKHFRDGISNGWKNLTWFLVGIVNIWPFILILLGIAGVVKISRKRKK